MDENRVRRPSNAREMGRAERARRVGANPVNPCQAASFFVMETFTCINRRSSGACRRSTTSAHRNEAWSERCSRRCLPPGTSAGKIPECLAPADEARAGYRGLREAAEYYRPHFLPDCVKSTPMSGRLSSTRSKPAPGHSTQLEQINSWCGITMDGWDWWDVILIITNRYGFGWDVLLTPSRKRKRTPYTLEERSEKHRRYHPE